MSYAVTPTPFQSGTASGHGRASRFRAAALAAAILAAARLLAEALALPIFFSSSCLAGSSATSSPPKPNVSSSSPFFLSAPFAMVLFEGRAPVARQ